MLELERKYLDRSRNYFTEVIPKSDPRLSL